ncbi:hypothetical protein ACERK3_15240 [Phycisphaerales bacterium AB-hyl4]|uniref:Uncharacterized protein n=1 Tax=Natronomicrosphaera hydrolytica TaxID=3242702 RepID=A0ABV4U7Q0_9BACT
MRNMRLIGSLFPALLILLGLWYALYSLATPDDAGSYAIAAAILLSTVLVVERMRQKNWAN